MISILREVEKILPSLLQDESRWNGLFADTKRPHLRRLWTQWGTYRICLHHFSECDNERDAFWHPHPWPCAIRTFSHYDMRVGFRDSDFGHLIEIARIHMQPGSCYEMCSKWGEHSILPVDDDIWSVMVYGPLKWKENREVENTPVRELNAEERDMLFRFFRKKYLR